jgi:tetrahydromethanopterin S-methyltransferase subunit A
MDNIAEEQIVKFLEGQQKVLRAQQEDIGKIKSDLSELSKQDQSNYSDNTIIELKKLFKVLAERQAEAVNHIIGATQSLINVKEQLDTSSVRSPKKYRYQYVLGGKIKWQLYPLIGFLGLVITASTIAYDNYRDKNDYKRAWKTLIEIQPSEEAKQTHLELLRLHRQP